MFLRIVLVNNLNMLSDDKENFNQQQVWDEIADGWTHYRHRPFRDTEKFAKKFQGKKILDIGCGNCRQLIPFIGNELYGIDFSKKMIKNAKKFCKNNNMKVHLLVAEATKLPFEDEYFDGIICISVIHHLKPEEANKAIEEIYRVLKKDGKGLISIWLKEGHGERYVSWQKKGKTLMRFHYFYSKDTIEEMIKNSGFEFNSWISEIGKNKQMNLFIEIRKQ